MMERDKGTKVINVRKKGGKKLRQEEIIPLEFQGAFFTSDFINKILSLSLVLPQLKGTDIFDKTENPNNCKTNSQI
jgi:hypothetical protein